MKFSQAELEELVSLLDYNPETGEFRWSVSFETCNKRRVVTVGDIAGLKTKPGYIRINYKSRHIMAHQLAWFVVHGKLPSKFIDHKDRNRTNNRIDNLREVTKIQNGQNRTLNRNSKTGIMGVTQHPSGKYCASITVNKRNTKVYFDTIEEAAAYRAEMVKQHFEKIS